MSTSLLMALLLGVASAAAPGDGCAVVVEEGVSPLDDEVHANSACARARTRFADLFGQPVPEVAIILQADPRYRLGLHRGTPIVFWPSSQAMSPGTENQRSTEEHLTAQWREVLPHEIAHLLLAARFFPDTPAAADGGYGTPFPDWLDEAVAIWAEPEESRRRRVEQAGALPPELLDLRSILNAKHPATGRSASFTARDGSARQAEFELWAFYPRSIALLTFIYERGGSEAMRALARRLQDDPTSQHALVGLPGLPDDFEEVEAAWTEWLQGLDHAP